MKLIIAGGRNYVMSAQDYIKLNLIHVTTPVTEVVSGKCSGADACGEQWAKSKGIPVTPFPADWIQYGKAAGPIRNREMAEYADAIALFPGDTGTQSMYEEAKRAGIIIFDFRDTHT